MNALTEAQLTQEMVGLMLTPPVIRAARLRAQREHTPVAQALQTELGLVPEALLAALGRALHLRVLDSHALATLEPAF